LLQLKKKLLNEQTTIFGVWTKRCYGDDAITLDNLWNGGVHQRPPCNHATLAPIDILFVQLIGNHVDKLHIFLHSNNDAKLPTRH